MWKSKDNQKKYCSWILQCGIRMLHSLSINLIKDTHTTSHTCTRTETWETSKHRQSTWIAYFENVHSKLFMQIQPSRKVSLFSMPFYAYPIPQYHWYNLKLSIRLLELLFQVFSSNLIFVAWKCWRYLAAGAGFTYECHILKNV